MAEKVYAIPNIATPNRPVIHNPEVCAGCNHCIEVCPIDVFIPAPVTTRAASRAKRSPMKRES